MKAVIYLRVSTIHQITSPGGLKDQLSACKKVVASLNNVKEVLVFQDAPVTGDTPIHERSGLPSALYMLKKNDFFIVAARDRIARNVPLMDEVERSIDVAKAIFISVAGEGTTIPGPQGLKIRRLADTKAELFRAQIKKSTKEALHKKKEQGHRIGTISYGFQLSNNGTSIEPCQKEQKIIMLVKQWREQGHSLRKIVKTLNEQSYKSRSGPFQLKQIWNMLKDYNKNTNKQLYLFIPFGFMPDKNSALKINSKEQAVIALVKELRQQGNSLRKIVKIVNVAGYRSRASTPFQRTQITRILGQKSNKQSTQTIQFGFAIKDGITSSCKQEQTIIQLAQSLKGQGYSLRNIVKEINAQGLTGRTGNPFQLTQISRMLKRTNNIDIV